MNNRHLHWWAAVIVLVPIIERGVAAGGQEVEVRKWKIDVRMKWRAEREASPEWPDISTSLSRLIEETGHRDYGTTVLRRKVRGVEYVGQFIAEGAGSSSEKRLFAILARRFNDRDGERIAVYVESQTAFRFTISDGDVDKVVVRDKGSGKWVEDKVFMPGKYQLEVVSKASK